MKAFVDPIVSCGNAVACTICRYLVGLVYIGDSWQCYPCLSLPRSTHGHEAVDWATGHFGQPSATLDIATIQRVSSRHLRHVSSSNCREKGSQRFHAMARTQLFLLTAPHTG